MALATAALHALEEMPLGRATETPRAIRWMDLRLRIEDSIAFVTLDNPPANALSRPMFEAVLQLLGYLEADQVRAVVVTGEGPSFSIGADPSGLADVTRDHLRLGHLILQRIEQCRAPWIAALNGHCLGGGLELALACHLRIASSRAKLGLPEVSLGLLPGLGGTHRLSRLAGRARAHEMILTGRPVKAEEAHAMGLLNAVVPPEDVLPAAERLARRIVAKSPAAVRAAMRCLNPEVDPAGETAEQIEVECFEQLTRMPGVRLTLDAIGRDLGARRE